MKGAIFYLILFFIILIFSNCKESKKNPKESHVSLVDKELNLFYKDYPVKNYIFNIDTVILKKYGGEFFRNIYSGRPMKIVNELDENNIQRTFIYRMNYSTGLFIKVPADTIVKFFASINNCSWSELFEYYCDSCTKPTNLLEDYIIKDSSISFIEGFNLIKAMNKNYFRFKSDSLIINNVHMSDATKKEINLSTYFTNYSSKTVSGIYVLILLTTYKDPSGKNKTNEFWFWNINLLQTPIPPKSFGIVETSINNKYYNQIWSGASKRHFLDDHDMWGQVTSSYYEHQIYFDSEVSPNYMEYSHNPIKYVFKKTK